MKNSPEAVASIKLFLSFIAGFSRNKMIGWEMKWEKGRGEWDGKQKLKKCRSYTQSSSPTQSCSHISLQAPQGINNMI